LIRKGVIQKDDIRVALETKIREDIYDLFLISSADFEFYINNLPEEIFDPVQKNTRIAINTSAVIMEGLRRVDEWRLIQQRIKTSVETFLPLTGSSAPRDEKSPPAEVLRRLEGLTPVSQLSDGSEGGAFDCAKAVYELAESGR